jgi:aminopeptidase N
LFYRVDSRHKPYIRFGVWARDSKLALGAHANDISPDLFNYYEQYTKTDYGMPKMDQLGFQDYFSGAMEDWGRISYT